MSRTRQASAQLLTFIALILAVQVVQSAIHWDLPYHFDEVWRVHSAIDQTWRQILYQRLEDVGNPIGDMFLLNLWISLVGYSPQAVRLLPMLITTVTLSCFIRLALDLSNPRTSRWALILLCANPLFMFYTRDAGPYPMVAFATCASTLLFVRWLTTNKAYTMVLYVAVGLLGIYSHYYIAFVVIGHALVLLVGVKWQWRKVLYGFSAFAAVAAGIIFGYGLLIVHLFLNPNRSQAPIFYLTPTHNLYDVYTIFMKIGLLLCLPLMAVAVFTPPTALKRGFHWRRWPQVFLLLLFFGMYLPPLSISTQVGFLQPRNLLILVPIASLLGAFTLVQLPLIWRAMYSVLALALMLTYSPYSWSLATPTRGIAASDMSILSERTRFILEIEVSDLTDTVGINYQIQRTLPYSVPNDHILIYHKSTLGWFRYPHHPQLQLPVGALIPQEVEAFLSASDQILWIVIEPITAPDDPLRGRLQQEFAQQTTYLSQERHPQWEWNYPIYDYRRVPTRDAPYFRFDDAITLENWRLADVNVTACQPVLIESWWQTDETLPANYSMSYSLIAADGQTALTDHGTLSNVLSLQWQPDEYYYDGRQVDLPCDLPAGEYALVMVVYDPGTAQPLDVAYPNGDAAPTDIYLTTLHVTAAPPEANP